MNPFLGLYFLFLGFIISGLLPVSSFLEKYSWRSWVDYFGELLALARG